MNKAQPGGIDYLVHAEALIGRVGYSHNIVTGCRHWQTGVCRVPCYAKRLVETRLKDNPAYPYGFEPTFHPERVREFGGKPKLIFLNDMGDVGGDWKWSSTGILQAWTPEQIAGKMQHFALLNPQHILLLLTKNPAWYALADWPENVWCGFTATNNEELRLRNIATIALKNRWVSLEPWLENLPPFMPGAGWPEWVVIGGQTRPDRPVSEATWAWITDKSIQAVRFVKDNARGHNRYGEYPRDYPARWRVQGD